ncbi:DUF2312 domain-containing protein [Sinorhizobium meliloti]|uniref:DUF2312 domain-containing protein n=1 Tax=Rhizobium meliloti TaxID=382 RepID=UPI001911EEDE|nr:DUF2312 domain-containing protein [Sinorhizobium meliloti]
MTDAHFIPDELATRTARLINEAEDMRAQAVDDLKTIYGDLREELKALGWLGQSISKEVAAFKAAISEMRLDEEQKAKREEKGDRIDDYVTLLSRSRAGARARTREGNANADAKLVETVAAGVQTEIGRAALIAAVDIMIDREDRIDAETGEILDDQTEIATASQGETESPSAEAEAAGAKAGGEDVESSAERARNAATNVANAAESVTAGETAPNSTAKPKFVLRPHCLNPGEACGGYSDKHCHACTLAMRKREQAEEVA